MANELRISKCVATPTNVIVYFSEALDTVTGANSPLNLKNYKVNQLKPVAPDDRTFEVGPEVPLATAYYDVINRAAVVQASAIQTQGQWLRIEANNLKSAGKPIGSSNVVRVKVVQFADGADSFSDKDQLQKVLQPSYAIGMGVIAQSDYTDLKNEYFAQCELSLGLIIPMILIVLGLKLTPQVGLVHTAWVVMCLAMAPISTVLFLIGAERYHKYRMELKLLILGSWKKQLDAKEAAATSASKQTPSGQSNTPSKIEVKSLVVEVLTKPPDKPDQSGSSGKGGPSTKKEEAGGGVF
jgi:hypothetical protein